MKIILGEDYLFWLAPTTPALDTNYLERTWSKAETIKMYRLNEFDTEQRISDPERKLYKSARCWSWCEKFIMTLIPILLWFVWL
jgi:hypothetical protein